MSNYNGLITTFTQRFRDGLSTPWQRQYDLARWGQDAAVRQRYLAALLGQFQALLDQIGWAEVAITSDVRRREASREA